jgi:hypothetical protein
MSVDILSWLGDRYVALPLKMLTCLCILGCSLSVHQRLSKHDLTIVNFGEHDAAQPIIAADRRHQVLYAISCRRKLIEAR